MKIKSLLIATGIAVPSLAATFWYSTNHSANAHNIDHKVPHCKQANQTTEIPQAKIVSEPNHCVFKTLMGEESSDSGFVHRTPEKSLKAVVGGIDWLITAQHKDGGWSANDGAYQGGGGGYKSSGKRVRTDDAKYSDRYQQDAIEEVDIQSVTTADPASTAMAVMALLRSGHTFAEGAFSKQMQKGVEFLCAQTERFAQHATTNTELTHTQPQNKLGRNIDIVLTSQALSNALYYLPKDDARATRIRKCINIAVQKIQNAQAADGSFQGDGWAGVLQSSFANNALEAADAQGAEVDKKVLDKSRDYQKRNYDTRTGQANTERGAGIMLYSVSSTSRAAAAETRVAKDEMKKAKRAGKLKDSDEISVENLQKAGMAESDALKYATAYKVNAMSAKTAQQADVMSGFGNNGGEEFMSFLQTGEGLIVAQEDWQNWYENVSGKLLQIQNQDGSWNGHHCITSPVFCTATCLLILSVHNEVALLQN
jgi:hypothetical protein